MRDNRTTIIVSDGRLFTGRPVFYGGNCEADYAVYENQPAQLPMCYVLQAAKA
ncbi:MAG: hypothetical protein JKX71_00730 [Amylibacter sp.]|nr:hypothetical protein [Amylibacter sp.]